jgi:hypothetical protein
MSMELDLEALEMLPHETGLTNDGAPVCVFGSAAWCINNSAEIVF